MRYPLSELTEAMRCPNISAKELAPMLRVTARTVIRWREDGLTETQADRSAALVGLPVRFVWPTWGDDPLPVCPWCHKEFTPRLEGQRCCSRRCSARSRPEVAA